MKKKINNMDEHQFVGSSYGESIIKKKENKSTIIKKKITNKSKINLFYQTNNE